VAFLPAGEKSTANVDRGIKNLIFLKFTLLPLFYVYLPPRGPNFIANFGGGMAGFSPWIRHCGL